MKQICQVINTLLAESFFPLLLQPNELKSGVARLTSTLKPVLKQIRLLQVTWILTSDWIKLRGSFAGAIPARHNGSYVTVCSLPWAGKTRNYVQILLQKVEPLSDFYNNFSPPTTTWFDARQPLIRGWYNAQNSEHCYSSNFAAMLQNKLKCLVVRYFLLYRYSV